jgi:predicted dienelactone hydrolase
LHELQREEGPLQGRLDLKRLGVSGHSFGGSTTLAIAGQVYFTGDSAEKTRLADPRPKAMLVMSGPGPKRKDRLDEIYGEIRIPGLHMTGTLDESPIGLTAVADRRVPFDRIGGADQFLLILQGGDHMVFASTRRLRKLPKDPRFHELILMSSTAFWDAYLRDDAKARQWLAGHGFDRALGEDGTFEKRLVPRE